MNLRILKKLSKRAAPLLAALGDGREQFPAERWEDYTGSSGHDRKHWRRNRARYPMVPRRGDIHVTPRQGEGVVILSQCYMHPWPGTAMVGWSVGYYEPEWEEDDAWTLLEQGVRDHFTEYRELPEVTQDGMEFQDFDVVALRHFRNPSQILRAVPELIELRRKEKAEHAARLADARAPRH